MKKLVVGMGVFTLIGSSLVFADGFSTSNAPKYDPKVTYLCSIPGPGGTMITLDRC